MKPSPYILINNEKALAALFILTRIGISESTAHIVLEIKKTESNTKN